MRRRAFIAMLGGATVLPLAASAHLPELVRKVGIIMAVKKTPEYVAAFAAFTEVLASLSWKDGDNLRIDDRWSAGGQEQARAAAVEIAALKVDVIVGQSVAVIEALV
jgi:putative ABC transport system substrate-binding protein